MKYIAYYRVYTQKQGRSGLDHDDRRDRVRRFLRGGEELAGEFAEIKSGRKREQPQLKAAIDAAKQNRTR